MLAIFFTNFTISSIGASIPLSPSSSQWWCQRSGFLNVLTGIQNSVKAVNLDRPSITHPCGACSNKLTSNWMMEDEGVFIALCGVELWALDAPNACALCRLDLWLLGISTTSRPIAFAYAWTLILVSVATTQWSLEARINKTNTKRLRGKSKR